MRIHCPLPRTIRSAFACFAFAGVLGAQAVQASLPPPSKCARLDQYHRIHVGDSIASLPEIARERTTLKGVRKAHFYFYLLNTSLPRKCMNLQCGTFARQILAQGGMLMGGAHEAYAKEVGMEPNASVLLVTDPGGKVTAIYRDVSSGDVSEILKVVSN
jgi:hypothetical protein